MENKHSFYAIRILTEGLTSYEKTKIDETADILFSILGCDGFIPKFESTIFEESIFFFRCISRKRKGQIIKTCEKVFPETINFGITSYIKTSYELEIERLQKNENFILLNEEEQYFSNYDGSDLNIFENKNDWHPWQKQIYDMLYNEDGTVKKSDDRQIVSIIDVPGNSGKSSFFKYLYKKDFSHIGRLTYGSSGQLRSSIINIGAKPIYIIDLSRAKGKADNEEDLLSVLEDVKSGIVSKAFHGTGESLLMAPPFVIVSSNYILNQDLLSQDRWVNFTIDEKKKTFVKLKRTQAKLLRNKEVRNQIFNEEKQKLIRLELRNQAKAELRRSGYFKKPSKL
jgi:hypothetical protein